MEIGKKPFFSSFPFSVLKDSCLALVYPQACEICGRSVESHANGYACAACWRKTRIFGGNEVACYKCGAFLKEGVSTTQTFCRRCDEDDYDRARAVGLYEYALAVHVVNLKREPFLPERLQKNLISAFADSAFQNVTRIIPVPLSARRFEERGFNQASVIARLIAKETGIALDEASLTRTTHTKMHRVGMDRKARNESVKNAFEVKRPNLIKNQNVMLIDDVFTSGATVSNCAKVLKKSGAAKVYVLTLTRVF